LINDRLKFPTIDQRWTTIGPKESTQVQRSADASRAIFFLRCKPTGSQVARIGAGGPLPYADAEGSVRIFEPSRRVEEVNRYEPTKEKRGDQNARHDS
jgi:hypothetical protein